MGEAAPPHPRTIRKLWIYNLFEGVWRGRVLHGFEQGRNLEFSDFSRKGEQVLLRPHGSMKTMGFHSLRQGMGDEIVSQNN